MVPVASIPQSVGMAYASRQGVAFPKIERVLVPVDLSECSAAALEYASAIARELRASLDIIHVWDPPSAAREWTGTVEKFQDAARSEVERWLTEFVTRHAGDTNSSHRIVGGLVVRTILDQATEGQHDLIVIGTHGRRGFARFAIGSVAESVLRKANCPVLCVRAPGASK